jgi:hypothetical protein
VLRGARPAKAANSKRTVTITKVLRFILVLLSDHADLDFVPWD